MAKIVNTRIQLKHDTLANWNSSNIALKYGEAAVAFVDTATTDAKGNIIHVPTALLKFGDSTGTKTFKDLPFASALAADVYAWAKAKDVERNGKVLQFKAADGTVTHSVSFDYLTEEDVNTLLANYYTKTEIDSQIDAIEKSITDLDVSAIVGRVENIEETINGYGDIVTHNVSEFATAAQGTKADSAVQPADLDPYAKSTDVSAEIDADVKVVSDALAQYKTDNDAALAGVKTTAEAATTVEEVDAQIDAKITALNLGTTYEPIGAETRAKAYADGLITDANLDQYTTEQEVKDIVDAVVTGAVEGDTITGLANLVEYINTHGGEAAEMAEAIDVLEGKVDTIEKKPAYAITSTQISNWDGEVGAKALAESKTTAAEVKTQIEAYGYATEADLTLAENRITTLEGKPAANITANQITNWDNEVGAKELAGTKTTAAEVKTQIEAYGYAVATDLGDLATKNNITASLVTDFATEVAKVKVADATHADSADVATKATQDADGNVITTTYATKAEVAALTTDDIEGGEEIWVFDCGTASTVI